jgi:hypothetical protein
MYLYEPVEAKEVVFPSSIRYISLMTILLLGIIFPLYWQSLFEICKEAAIALMG